LFRLWNKKHSIPFSIKLQPCIALAGSPGPPPSPGILIQFRIFNEFSHFLETDSICFSQLRFVALWSPKNFTDWTYLMAISPRLISHFPLHSFFMKHA
jgi:hypothetical protein